MCLYSVHMCQHAAAFVIHTHRGAPAGCDWLCALIQLYQLVIGMYRF